MEQICANNSVKTVPEEGVCELYGWENDKKAIWLGFFNKKVFESGLITEAEYLLIDRKIHDTHPLKKEQFLGKIRM